MRLLDDAGAAAAPRGSGSIGESRSNSGSILAQLKEPAGYLGRDQHAGDAAGAAGAGSPAGRVRNEAATAGASLLAGLTSSERIEISPTLAQAIKTAEPTAAGGHQPERQPRRMSTQPARVQLTLGQQLTLPNGQTIKQASQQHGEAGLMIFSLTVLQRDRSRASLIEAITRRAGGSRGIRLALSTRSSREEDRPRPSPTIKSGRSVRTSAESGT